MRPGKQPVGIKFPQIMMFSEISSVCSFEAGFLKIGYMEVFYHWGGEALHRLLREWCPSLQSPRVRLEGCEP